MMGYQNGFQSKLFYHQINLEKRVPKDHLIVQYSRGSNLLI